MIDSIIWASTTAVEKATLTAYSDESLPLCQWLNNSWRYKNRLAVAGVGKSHHLAQLASCTFASLGIPSLQLDTAHIVHGDSGFIGPEDAVLFISKSGKTGEMLNAIQCLIDLGVVNLFLLTCAEQDTLPPIIQLYVNVIKLPAECGRELNSYSPTTSSLSALAYLNAIAIKQQVFSQKEFARHHPGGDLGRRLNVSL